MYDEQNLDAIVFVVKIEVLNRHRGVGYVAEQISPAMSITI